jgi:response regulator NasT
MTRYQLTEDQAYQRLRSLAMNKNMKLVDVAQRLIDVEDLLG